MAITPRTIRCLFPAALGITFLLLDAPAQAQTCTSSVRSRVTAVTIYVCPSGNDANDGTTAGTALQTIQWATDCAVSNFDFARARNIWTTTGYIGYRPGPIVKLCDAPPQAPHIIGPLPLLFDGLGQTAPVYVEGNCGTPSAVNVYVANGTQGFSSQNGGVLIVRCLTMGGDMNTTLVNSLELGKIGVDRVYFGQGIQRDGQQGPLGAVGAAMLSSVQQLGDWHITGPYINTVMEAIELARIQIGQAPIYLDQNPAYAAMYVLGALSLITTEGAPNGQQFSGGYNWQPPNFPGACYLISRNSVIDFNIFTGLPCDPSAALALPGSWMYDRNWALRVMNFNGAWQ
jgi:hypothetical protein